MTVAIAGRSMPGKRPSLRTQQATEAPVFPAETNASASPSLTNLTAIAMEESFLPRIAAVGGSSIVTTSLVWTMENLERSTWYLSSSDCMRDSSPTSLNETSAGISSRAWMAPEIISCGALSPPIASSAMIILTSCQLRLLGDRCMCRKSRKCGAVRGERHNHIVESGYLSKRKMLCADAFSSLMSFFLAVPCCVPCLNFKKLVKI